jgi:hypothetical protein
VRYWIFDKNQSPQRFPLRELVRRVHEVAAPNAKNCEVTRARGYGLRINQWAEALDHADEIVVPFDLAEDLSQGIDEWFYDFEARIPNTDIRFGLHDSTAMFVDAPLRIAEQVAQAFSEVRQGAR